MALPHFETKIFLKPIIGVFLLMSLSAKVLADTNALTFDSEFLFDWTFSTKPTSDAGDNAFKIPSFKIGMGKKLGEGLGLRAVAQFGPSRFAAIGTSNVGQFHAGLEEAFAAFQNVSHEQDQLRIGLVPHPWIESINSLWGYHMFTDGGNVLLERMGYLPRADLGLIYTRPLSENWLLVGTLINGEGLRQDEQYSGKDLQMQFEYRSSVEAASQTYFGLIYSYGNYDNIGMAANTKDRLAMMLAYTAVSGTMIGLEAYQGRDPVDAINQISGIADGVDLSTQGGKEAVSQGAAIYLRYRMQSESGPYWDLLAKLDYFNPMLGFGRWTGAGLIGLSKKFRDYVTLFIGNVHWQYSELSYGNSRRETNRWYLSTKIVF